jgi:hypothetical protein
MNRISGTSKFVVLVAVATLAVPQFWTLAAQVTRSWPFRRSQPLRAYDTSTFGTTVPQALMAKDKNNGTEYLIVRARFAPLTRVR